jgi:hypothetical protein
MRELVALAVAVTAASQSRLEIPSLRQFPTGVVRVDLSR